MEIKTATATATVTEATIASNGFLPRTLEAIQRRATCYEVIAVTPAGTYRLGFTAKPSKVELLAMARFPRNMALILPHVSDSAKIKYSRLGGWTVGKVSIRLSGRTERTCSVEEIAR